MPRELHDHFFRKAKREGYLSRAAFKLLEIHEKRKVLKPGDRVLDCGCAPGSWIQAALTFIGRKGVIVGIDLKQVTHQYNDERVHLLEGDLFEAPSGELTAPIGGELFTVILSDMAPNTTGDRTIDHHGSVRLCHEVLDRCGELLTPGGQVVMKVLEGEVYPDLMGRTRRMFEKAKGFRPAASRKESTEIFLIGSGYRGKANELPAPKNDEPEIELPKRKPSTGWGN